MLVLVLIGFLGGIVTGISPCIIPVIPVVFAAGAASGLDGGDPRTGDDRRPEQTPGETDPGREPVGVGAGVGSSVGSAFSAAGRPEGGTATGPGAMPAAAPAATTGERRVNRRPLAVVGGLVLSFSIFTLVGTSLLSALGLPQDFLRDAGLVVLMVVAIGLIVPSIGDLLERPFARLVRGRQHDQGGGLVLGLSLGVLFVPCAGPVLAAITVVSANHRIGLSAVMLTVAFALGVSVPLLIFAIAGQRLAGRMKVVRTRAALVRKVVGVVLLVTAVAIGSNWTAGLQRALPGYTDTLQTHLESSASAKKALGTVTGNSGSGALSRCTDGNATLQQCGAAPAFTGIDQWLNTPGNKPLTFGGLRGKVVLVDFWTYSCINCQRSLPHVEAWNRSYAADGLVIVGVHTPEFPFEHVVANVSQASAQLGVTYPIAIDNQYSTWDVYQNQYWPAEYLVDAAGHVRHVHFGEGQYSQTESLVRQLLVAADPTVKLPAATDLPDTTPTEETTPESYLGYHYQLPYLAGQSVQEDQAAVYTPPSPVPPDEFAFSGEWTVGSESAKAGTSVAIDLRFQASDVYLVLGGTGTVTVSVNGQRTKIVTVSGEPKLYTLVQSSSWHAALLSLAVSPGVDAYDFTFG